MQTFLDLISQYSIGEIIVFLVMLFLSFKQIVEFIDWIKGKIEKRDKKQLNQYQEEKDLYKEIEYFKEYVQQSQKYLSKMQEQIDLLIESDKDAIKAYITKEHHHFCYEQKWIDDYSLDCLEKRFGHYVEEHGNSFIESLMTELRNLPRREPDNEGA